MEGGCNAPGGDQWLGLGTKVHLQAQSGDSSVGDHMIHEMVYRFSQDSLSEKAWASEGIILLAVQPGC